MAVRNWEVLKVCYCGYIDAQVGLEAEVVFPAELLPDQAPRVVAHRCSRGVECGLVDKPGCVWAGTNPAFDPFQE
jgi:hypothetical protein